MKKLIAWDVGKPDENIKITGHWDFPFRSVCTFLFENEYINREIILCVTDEAITNVLLLNKNIHLNRLMFGSIECQNTIKQFYESQLTNDLFSLVRQNTRFDFGNYQIIPPKLFHINKQHKKQYDVGGFCYVIFGSNKLLEYFAQ